MAANYTGNAGSVQAPSPAPAVNTDPIGSLPADSDGSSWANLFQVLKVCLDFLSWLSKVVGGTRTAKALMADGTGGATVVATPGCVQSQSMGINHLGTVFDPGLAHLAFRGPTPAVVCTPAGSFLGAGTGATANVNGTDMGGILTVNIGTGPTGLLSGICRVDFANAFPTGTVRAVILTPFNAAAAALSGATQVFVGSIGGTNWFLSAGNTALAASTTYMWHYWVVGA